jgi:uncharacterized heparinase superfamily protein
MSLAPPTRWVRLTLARLPQLGLTRVPDAPLPLVRDLWQGDAARGALLLRGEIDLGGVKTRIGPATFTDAGAPPALRAAAHSFVWLRDLRAAGTDAARMQARAMVDAWMTAAPRDRIADRPDIAGARIAAWLGHYDFFAASADDGFRQILMANLLADARTLAALLPAEEQDARALTALKGLVAAGIGLPEQQGMLARALRLLPAEIAQQFLPDGMHAERSPAQLQNALQDLLDIRAMLQSGQVPPPGMLTPAIERAANALRTVRHGDGRQVGDGRLALFNGSREENAVPVEAVLSQTGRSGKPQPQLPQGGFIRLAAGKTLVLADCGRPPSAGLDRFAHAGALSFEMSVGRDRLIVNCGAVPAATGPWREASAATAAHSTLTIANVSSSEVLPAGLGRKPDTVTCRPVEEDGLDGFAMTHDGWMLPFQASHRRQLYIAPSGDSVVGVDSIVAPQPQPFVIRFHLHPAVDANLQNDGLAVLLNPPNGRGWRLRASGMKLSLEESIYLGGPSPRKSEQVVITGYDDGPQSVQWDISRL